ncbi:hypothetical protein AMATHDRAFT_74048 [Amanita thiersii Skay4041]|uniref:Nucleoporin Nup120/160-domain-containing protein n=1 Tax=Amanita thiersii Skay4041 TaxID=703135 RepID=A0A2A9NT92_9AGAR|nr:hypothetical protein AMATHDRAFT_74048 [Amanita thiersii Skay4041]
MDPTVLLDVHLSSLHPSLPNPIPVNTARHSTPLPIPSPDPDHLPEHATFTSFFNSSSTGTILLRMLHSGLIIELLSLSTDIPPLRFVFPALVLPAPVLFIWNSSQLHLLVVTSAGSLYRLVVPLSAGRQLWKGNTDNVCIREYLIKTAPEAFVGPVHAQGIDSIAIGLSSGALLRIETDLLGRDEQQDEWTETAFQHGSFLSSLTSFLPLQNSSAHTASDIVSLASFPWPTDIGHVWSLSRDRTLRLWKAKTGCVSTRTLSMIIPGRDSFPKHQLLDGTHQNLLRVFGAGSGDDQIYTLAFLPNMSSSTSGGIFRLVTTVADNLHDLGAIGCSSASAHCRLQDFLVVDDILYTLWDRQGQSFIEKTVINVESFSDADQQWHAIYTSPEPEHTPGYLEKLLLSPGSIVEKGLKVVLRPGAFSTNTLRTAIEEYTDACFSLPGSIPSPLTSSYATLAENVAGVVGCTVKLIHDAQIGAPQYSSYWNSIKRDWEGFISRCSRLERLGSRPLAIGMEEQGCIIVIERDHVRTLISEDLPLYLCHLFVQESSHVDSQYDILSVAWTLKSVLNPQVTTDLESRLEEQFRQGITFSFSDLIQDHASHSKIFETLDEGTANWILGRLQSIDDIDAAIKTALDVIGGLDMEVKREEDEVELLLPSTSSHWLRATTAAYIAATIGARYDLCFSLVVLLFFLANDLAEWDPALLAEVLAVYRGVCMLRRIAKQPGSDWSTDGEKNLSTDDVILKLRNMNVSRHKVQATSSYSLIHHLLAQSDSVLGLPGAAHRFLDSSGLLQSVSPAHGTKFEVLFCERLRLLRYYDLTREFLSWLPKTPGVSYVQSRLWLDLGRADDASELLQKLSGCFGTNPGLSLEDQEALTVVLPTTNYFDSEFAFYVHAAGLLKQNLWINHEALFARLAISVAPTGMDTSALWFTVIKGYIELGQYEDAYSSLMCCPYEKPKRECVSQLTYKMCEDDAISQLLSFNFAGISDEVEDAMSFKARNVDPRVKPCYTKISYAWYTSRGDHRNAALAMYHRARKLQELITNPQTFVVLAEEQLQAYTIALNSLSLVDQSSAYIVLPVSSDNQIDSRKRRRLTKHIPETKYGSGRYDAEIVQLADIQYDYALLSAQIDLVRSDPMSVSSEDFQVFPPPSLIILKLALTNHFDQAMTYARSLNVDMTDLFTHLTRQCLKLTREPDLATQDVAEWLYADKAVSWSGPIADRGWKYLRNVVALHDSKETDYKYTKAIFETLLAHDRKSPPPPWITRILEEYHPEFLIRTSLRYENYADAVGYSLSITRKAHSSIRDSSQNASLTWLPYTLLDQVLAASKSLERPPAGLNELELELSNYVKRVERMTYS